MERYYFLRGGASHFTVRACRSPDTPDQSTRLVGDMLQSTTFLSFGSTVAQRSQLTIKRAMTPLNH